MFRPWARRKIRPSDCIRAFTDKIEWVNLRVGEFVAYWAVISVFGYYYEVIARFAFNSPTNWLHESMFLMYGMQYMLAGAYTYQLDQHVRVDVFYVKFSPRGKAIADIITSVFFFIFVGTLLWTSWKFASDVGRPRRSLVHRMGRAVLAGEADDADRRRAVVAARRLQD